MESDLRLRVRLTRKLADSLDGIDVSKVRVGQCVELPPASARTLILEGWAELVDPTPMETTVEAPAETIEPSKEGSPKNEPEPY